MAGGSGTIRWDLVRKARARLAGGQYEPPSVLDAILSTRLLDAVLLDLDACPVGDGHRYRDLVAEVLSGALGEIVDEPLARKEIPAAGGRGDIELPLRLEKLDEFPLWNRWERRYDIRSVIVETKNEKRRGRVEDVSQLAGYFNATKLGRFGILVARKGFSSRAMQNMTDIARDGSSLILPLDHEDLHQLVKATQDGHGMEYLRRRSTLLLQA